MINLIFYGLLKTIDSYEKYNISPGNMGKLFLFGMILSYSILVYIFV